MSDCLARLVAVLEAGREAGAFQVDDADRIANVMYAVGLGGLQLARLGVMVREVSPGVPGVASIDPVEVKRLLVASTLAVVRA
jgi:pantoate kinase